MINEVRWWKGKHKVRILQKNNLKGWNKPHMLVEVLEDIMEYRADCCFPIKQYGKGEQFTTVPRLLLTHPRNTPRSILNGD